MDLDTFITTFYVLIDDWYKSEIDYAMQRHAGPGLEMSDSEVLTVAIAGQWQVGVPWRSERSVVRYMQQHGRHWFPGMLQRSQFNQRVRDLWAALVRLQQIVAQELWAGELYECVDCVPLPHCSLAQAASHDRHWLSGGLGYGGNQGGWYWGEQLLISVTATGVVTGWLVGQAQIEDRWMMEAFVSTRHEYMGLIGPEPPPQKRNKEIQVATAESFSPAITTGVACLVSYLADEGFNGQRWIAHWQDEYEATVITAPPANPLVLSLTVQGQHPVALQWYRNGAAIAGATNRFLVIPHATPAHSGNYTLEASNALGRADSGPLQVTVTPDAGWVSGVAEWRESRYGRPRLVSAGQPASVWSTSF